MHAGTHQEEGPRACGRPSWPRARLLPSLRPELEASGAETTFPGILSTDPFGRHPREEVCAQGQSCVAVPALAGQRLASPENGKGAPGLWTLLHLPEVGCLEGGNRMQAHARPSLLVPRLPGEASVAQGTWLPPDVGVPRPLLDPLHPEGQGWGGAGAPGKAAK